MARGKVDKSHRVNLTMQRCASLPCPEGEERIYYHDTQTPALRLCVTCAGTRIFYINRRINGRAARVKIGRFPDISLDKARKEAQKVNGNVAAGIDPNAVKRAARNEATLQELFHHFLEQHAKPHKKTWDEDERQFNTYLAKLKNRPLSSIGKAEVKALHTKLGKDSGPYQANRVLAMLSTMFNMADEVGWKGENPCNGVRKFEEKSRERFLQADELPRFFVSLEQEENDTLRDYFFVSLFTGARRGNVQAMRWDELNLAAGTWTIPETKNGQPVTVALVPEVIERLRQRQQAANGSPWVFANRRKSGKVGHLTEPKTAWARLLDRAGIENLRIHDLRRTLGSWQAATGASLPIIGKSLGHKNTATTAVYARLNIDPVRQAVTTAATAILAAGKPASDRKGEEE